LDQLQAQQLTLKYIFETHFHADFVSGHVTLAEKTGAPIVFGPLANPSYTAYIAQDGERFKLGACSIEVLHTPGHTMESSCYLLRDEHDVPKALFSGDTLFLGDVGRPDLAQKAANMTQEELAGLLFDSLRNKIMPLADEIVVYPAHGAGSACGKNLSKETFGLLGDQKATNYALRANMSRAEFIQEVTDGLLPSPAYFPMNVHLNKVGYPNTEDLINKVQPLDAAQFDQLAQQTQAIILDVRHQADFSAAHIPGSIFIGLDGTFAPWVGALLPTNGQPILLVTPEGREAETVIRLSRVGFDHTIGYLKGGMQTWIEAKMPVDHLPAVEATAVVDLLNSHAAIFDVRKPGEYEASHIEGVPSTPLDFMDDHLGAFPKNAPFYVHCAGGYRSVIAASILKAKGYHQVVDILGGFAALKQTTIPLTTTCSAS
jgi:glyoxylase-like metal-dependent hydrolase (beta-lactamase superfamily II)/rhodanese-related sulfurtransferase